MVSAKFHVEVTHPDAHTCRVVVTDLSGGKATTLYETRVSVEDKASARKRALAETGRFLAWYLTPPWGEE